MERLNCHVKEYAWGKHGKDSEVARLFAAGHEDFVIGKSTPYAEVVAPIPWSLFILSHNRSLIPLLLPFQY